MGELHAGTFGQAADEEPCLRCLQVCPSLFSIESATGQASRTQAPLIVQPQAIWWRPQASLCSLAHHKAAEMLCRCTVLGFLDSQNITDADAVAPGSCLLSHSGGKKRSSVLVMVGEAVQWSGGYKVKGTGELHKRTALALT